MENSMYSEIVKQYGSINIYIDVMIEKREVNKAKNEVLTIGNFNTTKPTAKEFKIANDKKDELQTLKYDAQRNDDSTLVIQTEKNLELLNELYFNNLPTVNVKYAIGYRSYWNAVVKIGKSYFLHGTKMTESRGYRVYGEIEKITEENKESMLSDSYHY